MMSVMTFGSSFDSTNKSWKNSSSNAKSYGSFQERTTDELGLFSSSWIRDSIEEEKNEIEYFIYIHSLISN